MLQEHLLQLAAEGAYSHAFLGALIGGAVSLVGGLMGRSDAKKKDKAAAEAAKVPQVTKTDSKTYTHEELQVKNKTTNKAHQVTNTSISLTDMVKEAEKAGFNPLTVLRAGLGGAFSKTESRQNQVSESTTLQDQKYWSKVNGESVTTGHNAMAAVPTAPSLGSVVSNAASTAFDIYRQDAARAADAAQQRQMQDAALRGIQAANSGMSRSMYVPSTVTAGPALSSAGSAALARGAPVTPTYETPTVTNPYKSFKVDTGAPDAEAAETRYGDVLSNIFGVKNWIDDVLYNITGTTLDERAKVNQGYVTDATAALTNSVNKAKAVLSDDSMRGIGRTIDSYLGTGKSAPNGGVGGW